MCSIGVITHIIWI